MRQLGRIQAGVPGRALGRPDVLGGRGGHAPLEHEPSGGGHDAVAGRLTLAGPPGRPRRCVTVQVATLEAGLAAQAPAELLAPFAAEQTALAAAGLPEGIPTPGTPMPDGELIDVHGKAITLEQARAGGPAVVVFYRG
ncbi:MAG: hypothetical protein ABR562_10300, partial [Thermoplasmatota archaeon]